MKDNAASDILCRIVGDYILTENDIRGHAEFADAIVRNDSAFCVHLGGNADYDFRLGGWIWDMRDGKPYDIPYRCLYSRNLSNLMMAGKHISASRAASTSVKMMGNGIQHGIAAGCAAALCCRHNATPREIGRLHMDELRERVNALTLEEK